jgi:hypothetical protein
VRGDERIERSEEGAVDAVGATMNSAMEPGT